MFFYFLLLVLFLIVLSCIDVWQKQRYVKTFGKVECYPQMPIIGSVHYILVLGFWTFLKKISDNQTCLFWILRQPVYFTKDPEELRIILTNKNTLGKASPYKLLETVNSSLLGCNVETWKIHRRLLNKCFNQKQMTEFQPIFNEFGTRLSQQFRPEMTTQEVGEILFQNSMNNFHASVGNFGTKDFTSLVQNIISISTNEVLLRLTKRYLHPWLYPDFVYYRTEDGKKFREIMSKVNNTFTEVLEQKHKNKSNWKLKYDFMQILLEEYKTQERLNELVFFSVASSETTTASMTASVLLLGMYQDIQEKVYQEIITIIGKNNLVESHHLSQLKYMHMFINESLRLFPSANYIGRRTSDDLDLGNGKTIPRGTDIFISIQNLHRDERVWKDPLEFIPERFLPEDDQRRHPFTFLPFSYGPRNCIGLKYAEVVMKINLVKILSKYRITSNCNNVAEIKVPFMALSYMPGHFKLRFEQRCT